MSFPDADVCVDREFDLARVSLRTIESRDVEQVNRLFVEEYGPYPYLLEDASGPGVQLVAEARGEVIGFARATPVAGYARAFEFGGLIVRRDFRGRHVAKRLLERRLSEVVVRGGRLAVSEPVCYRRDCASQHNLIDRGFVLTGILPGKYPEIHRDLLGDQPESMVMAARALLPGETTGLGERRVFLPNGLPGLLRLFLPRDVYERGFGDAVPGRMPAVVEHASYQSGAIKGSSFVDIPINWPEAEQIVLAFLADGYRFAAILPGFGATADGHVFDLVRLYKPPAGRLNFDLIHVAPQLQRLHAFMRRECAFSPR